MRKYHENDSEILKEINVLSAAASGDTEITGVCSTIPAA